ncbi:MAG: DUF1211 domain-containing protein [Deltaproteobacteria bacterium]|nr:DUF1211 domain-containing protein [Deltaproteobacteria bacterium]
MGKGRLEAFSDGVFAIILTIMVLELKVPQGADLTALETVAPVFFTYLLSFVFVGIYWVNHHHLLHVTQRVNGKILWANLHLLFWLSLFPWLLGWMQAGHFAALPTAVYGIALLMAAVAYTILTRALVSNQGQDSALAAALGSDFKGKFSIVLYATAIPLAFVHPRISDGLYAMVALMWLIPDRRIEANVKE